MCKIGLIVNPVAGLGGRVGLKGTDGREVVEKARKLGAKSEVPARTVRAIWKLEHLRDQCVVLTYPKTMGEQEVAECGFRVSLVGHLAGKESTAGDTKAAAKEMLKRGVNILVFSGGDGTARDIYESVGTEIVVVGIPAGVKMHSGVFASTPEKAGELAARYLEGKERGVVEAEVMDIDEDAFREGEVQARLYGYLTVPLDRQLVQGKKVATPPSEHAAQQAIAAYVVDVMESGVLYLVGPGTTTRAIMKELGVPYTLLGVDAVRDGKLVGKDLAERDLLKLLGSGPAKLVVSPIGGQGHIFGRGNQQLSPKVIRRVGRENIIVVATQGKLSSLHGKPLLVDTGDGALDQALSGYIRVMTGYREEVIHRVEC